VRQVTDVDPILATIALLGAWAILSNAQVHAQHRIEAEPTRVCTVVTQRWSDAIVANGDPQLLEALFGSALRDLMSNSCISEDLISLSVATSALASSFGRGNAAVSVASTIAMGGGESMRFHMPSGTLWERLFSPRPQDGPDRW
jgi:hypothetical protein